MPNFDKYRILLQFVQQISVVERGRLDRLKLTIKSYASQKATALR
ncbi:hypothetical protein CHELA1G11_20939 [Hyphomicrobiales bacterium]|nr:hypothetical protein CHELA1G11_20939 [Hyphomicrobiales bacterium]CAH1692669.1 hypothetical protein CHELA1G2_21254 [Hyphomicrobiales bacterium]